MKATIMVLALMFSGAAAWAAETNLVEILHQKMRELGARESGRSAAVRETNIISSVSPLATAVNPAAALPLGAGDVVTLTVENEPDLGLERALVDAEGRLTHKLLGALPVAGKTVEEAGTTIRELLAKDYLVDPKVRLVVVERALGAFTIAGAVTKPGAYTWPRREPMSILKAVALAGGVVRGADLGRITVQRIVDGRQQIVVLDLEVLNRDPNARPFLLQAGDVVEVPRKR